MKFKRPSAAMVVALIALVMSMTGGAIAAVNYAKNAGAVDGYSAVRAKSSNNKAAGRLVATYPGGKLKGKLPFRFLSGAASQKDVERLSDLVVRGRNAADLTSVVANQETAAKTVIDLELGNLQISCLDQAQAAGTEDAATRIGITNHSGGPVNLAREVGNNRTIRTLANGTVDRFTIGQANTFSVQLQGGQNKTVLIEGTALQRGEGTPDSACAMWATALFVE